jgi:hypothetical protein
VNEGFAPSLTGCQEAAAQLSSLYQLPEAKMIELYMWDI